MNLATLQIIMALEPGFMAIGKDIWALIQKHPQLTPEMILSIVTAIHATNADTFATVAADQAAHSTP